MKRSMRGFEELARCQLLHSISQSKSCGQPGFKDWENQPHVLIGGAVKSVINGMGAGSWRIRNILVVSLHGGTGCVCEMADPGHGCAV